MTPHKWHSAYTAHAAADLSHVTVRPTYTANIDKNCRHLTHSMQPKEVTKNRSHSDIVSSSVDSVSLRKRRMRKWYLV